MKLNGTQNKLQKRNGLDCQTKKVYLSKHTKRILIPQYVFFFIGITCCALQNSFTWSWFLASYLGWVLLGVMGVSTAFHKYYAHQSFAVRPQFLWLIRLFGFLGLLTGQGSILSYSAVHIGYHHKYADQSSKDPHSPRFHSLWHAYYGWHFTENAYFLNSVKRLMNDPFVTWSHKYYYRIFWISHLVIGLISWKFLLFFVVIPSLVHINEMNILNSFCHSKWFGYRNFSTNDNSVNNWLFGILTWGTGFHNNHHAKPYSYHNQVYWYEFDPFKYIIPLISQKKLN